MWFWYWFFLIWVVRSQKPKCNGCKKNLRRKFSCLTDEMSSAGDAFSFAYICSWPQRRILAGSIIVGRRIVLRQGRFLFACAWFLIPDFLNWECGDINAILDLVFGAQWNNTVLKMMISTIQLTHTHTHTWILVLLIKKVVK